MIQIKPQNKDFERDILKKRENYKIRNSQFITKPI